MGPFGVRVAKHGNLARQDPEPSAPGLPRAAALAATIVGYCGLPGKRYIHSMKESGGFGPGAIAAGDRRARDRAANE